MQVFQTEKNNIGMHHLVGHGFHLIFDTLIVIARLKLHIIIPAF